MKRMSTGSRPILAVVFVFLLSFFVVGGIYLPSAQAEDKKEEPKEGEAKEGDAKAAKAPDEGLTVKLDPTVVNVLEKNTIHYIKVGLEVSVSTPETLEEIKAKMSLLKDKLIYILSDISLREALTLGGKSLLKEDIQSAFNKILTKGKITGVYFTEFTIQ